MKIINIGILAHVDAGKTTLTESLLYASGAISEPVSYTHLMLPAHAPPEFSDRSTLWNSVEQIEKASDSQLAREIEAALPRELSREQQLALVRAYVKDNFCLLYTSLCCIFG